MISWGFRALRPAPLCLAALLALVFAEGAGAATTAPDAPAACSVQPVATLPLRIEGGRFVTTLQVEGTAVSAVVDTGTGVSTLDRAVADRLKLRRDPSKRTAIVGIGGRSKENLDYVVADRVGLGPLTLSVISFVRADLTAGRPASSRFDALLGADILSGYDLDFDAPHARLVLSKVEGCAGRFVDWPPATESIPLTSLFQNRLKLAPLAVDGHPMTAVVDTGATQSLMFAGGVRRMGKSFRTNPGDVSGYGIGAHGANRVKVVLHRFATLRLGAAMTPDPLIAVAHTSPMDLDMILGLDYLAKRRFWLSYATDQLFLAPP